MKILTRLKRIVKVILSVFKTIKVYPTISVVSQNSLLKNRCALITGGTSGIGFSIAETFLKSGASVIITGRNQERIKEACSKLNDDSHVFGFCLDNTKVDTFPQTFDSILKAINEKGVKQIDILVNNAGVIGGNLPNASEEDYDKVLDTNLKGVFFLSQIFSKYMVKNNIRGNILNIASSSSLRPAVSAYTLSKWGIRGLTMGLARSLAKYGITVNGIAPGQTATPMLNAPKENFRNETCPLGRWILPEEIANGALFLVSDLGRAVVGDILYMTGGSALLSFEDMNYNIFDNE